VEIRRVVWPISYFVSRCKTSVSSTSVLVASFSSFAPATRFEIDFRIGSLCSTYPMVLRVYGATEECRE
jgi:hypothetical protein